MTRVAMEVGIQGVLGGQVAASGVKGTWADVTNNVKVSFSYSFLWHAMISRLSSFAREVTRVALEVGTQGRLGGQAVVLDIQGTWAELIDNVNVRHYHSVNRMIADDVW